MNKTVLRNIVAELSDKAVLVAVSKTRPIADILEAYEEGQRDFGENKVQELIEKEAALPKDIRWHFIGHLQTNKIKYVVPVVKLFHGVDSLKVLLTIEKESLKQGLRSNVLLQVKIATEESKFGFLESELIELLSSEAFLGLTQVNVMGLMGMATNTDDYEQVLNEFKTLKNLFDKIKQQFFSDSDYFRTLSMGMSHDYKIALKQGSNMVRVGSSIFGPRQY